MTKQHTRTVTIGVATDGAGAGETERVDCPGVIYLGMCTSCERTPVEIADDNDWPTRKAA